MTLRFCDIALYRSHYGPLVRLGVPIIVGNIGHIVLSFADTLMIGRYGMKELAAASFVNTLIVLLIIFALGYSLGLTPIVGSRYGRGEKASIGQVVRQAVVANLLLSLLLVAIAVGLYLNLHRMGQPEELLPLMRPFLLVLIVGLPFVCVGNVFKNFFDVIGETKLTMLVLVMGNVVNIVGNYLLIYGVGPFPELGLVGAGISTTVARIFIPLCFVGVLLFRHRYRVYLDSLLHQRRESGIFAQLNRLGWPSALQTGMETAAFSLTAVFVGWIGTMALAAHQVMITVSQLFYMVYLGIAVEVSVRVSHFNGQGDHVAIRHTTWAGFHLILLIALMVSVPIVLLRHEIGAWFTDDASVHLLVAQCVIPLIIYQFGDGMQCTFANALRGLGCMKPLMYGSFVAYFVVSLPLSWFWGIYMGWGIVGIWFSFPVCLTVAAVIYYAIFRRRYRVLSSK